MRLAGVHIPPALEQTARGYRAAARVRFVVAICLTLAVAVTIGYFATGAGVGMWWRQTIVLLLLVAGLIAVTRWTKHRTHSEATRLVHEHKSCVCGGQPAPPTRTVDGHELYTCAACGDTWELEEHGEEVPKTKPRDWPRVVAGVPIPPGLREKAKHLARHAETEALFTTLAACMLIGVLGAALGSVFGVAPQQEWFNIVRTVGIVGTIHWAGWRTTKKLLPKVQAFLNAEGYCICGYPSINNPHGTDVHDRLCPECGATWTIAPPAG
jgi:hypothetical protein